MKTLLLTIFIAVYSASVTNGETPLDAPKDCAIPDRLNTYRKTIYYLCVQGYKVVAALSNVNFVMAPRSIWMTLAAIAEGSDKATQKELFKHLKLSEDPCIRQKFYETASTRLTSDNARIVHNKTLLIDEDVSINSTWHDFVSKYSFLDVVKRPIKKDPVATAAEVKRIMGANVPELDLTGNSVILDVINYNGLWKTAFADAVNKRSPFYSLAGEQIGFVDLMRVKRKVKMGYVKSINAKVLELAIGANSEYRIMFGLLLDRNVSGFVDKINNDILFEMANSLKDSNVPVDIAIPKVELSYEIDVRNVLEVLGVKSIWTNPEATQFISTPPATPSSYLQRVTWTLDTHGVASAPIEQDPSPGTPTGLDPEVGTEFIADRPFLYGLFDAETYTPILGAGFSTPTYQ